MDSSAWNVALKLESFLSLCTLTLHAQQCVSCRSERPESLREHVCVHAHVHVRCGEHRGPSLAHQATLGVPQLRCMRSRARAPVLLQRPSSLTREPSDEARRTCMGPVESSIPVWHGQSLVRQQRHIQRGRAEPLHARRVGNGRGCVHRSGGACARRLGPVPLIHLTLLTVGRRSLDAIYEQRRAGSDG